MYVLLFSLVAAVVVGAAIVPFFGWLGAILPFLAAFAITWFLLIRRVNAQLQSAMASVSAAIQKRNVDEAIVALQAVKARFSKWTFFIGAQIDGQIGSIYYMKKEFEKARPYLEKAFARSWDAKLMHAVLVSGALDTKKKKGDLKAADDILEKAIQFSPKQGLLWSTWAWLHWNADEKDRAVALLSRGKAELGEADAILSQNLLALQNDKKMKMKGYGDPWYALHLEEHPMLVEQRRGGNVRFARR